MLPIRREDLLSLSLISAGRLSSLLVGSWFDRRRECRWFSPFVYLGHIEFPLRDRSISSRLAPLARIPAMSLRLRPSLANRRQPFSSFFFPAHENPKIVPVYRLLFFILY